MLKYAITFLSICVLLLTGCDFPDLVMRKGIPDERTICTVYYSSFETESDTAGWRLYEGRLYPEGSPLGYHQSLLVSGGCYMPHVRFKVAPADHDRRVILQFWGRALIHGGMVEMHYYDHESQTGFGVSQYIRDSTWTFYPAQDTMLVLAHNEPVITAWSGGAHEGAMLIDNVHVEEVDADCNSIPDPSIPVE